MAFFACSILRNACCNIFHDRKASDTDGDVGNKQGGTVACYPWLFWGLPGQVAVVLCRLVAVSSSSYSPRVTRPGRQTAGLLLVRASRVASLSLLLQHRTDVIGRAYPTKSPPVGVGEPGKSAIPITLKTTGHHAHPLQRLAGRVCPSAMLPWLGLSPSCLSVLTSTSFPTLRFQLSARENETYRLRQSAHPFRGGE